MRIVILQLRIARPTEPGKLTTYRGVVSVRLAAPTGLRSPGVCDPALPCEDRPTAVA